MTRTIRWRLSLSLQWRHGFVPAFALTTVLMSAVLRALPPTMRQKAAQVLIAADPLFFAFLFAGSFLMLEKSDGTLEALAASPYPTRDYLLERGLSIGLTAAAAGIVLAAAGGLERWAAPTIVAAQLLGAAGSGAAGIAIAAKAKSINGFFLAAAPAMAFMAVPLLHALFGFPAAPIAACFPGYAVVAWIGAGIGRPLGGIAFAASAANALVWTAASFLAARRAVFGVLR